MWSHWNRFGISPAKKSIQVIVFFFVCLTFSPERYLFICHLDDFGKGAAIFGLFGMIKQVTLILALQMKQIISF